MELHIDLQPDIIATFLGFPFSNTLALSIVSAVLLASLGVFIAGTLRSVPGMLQNGAEVLIGGMLDFTAQVLGGDKEQAKQFFPIVAAFFFFILFNNWMGLVPGIGAVGIASEEGFLPIFRPAASDLNATLALAIISVITTQVYGIRKLGLTYFSKFFTFKGGAIHAFVGLLELVAEAAKILSFTFRLFGNIFAGKVLLLVIAFLIPLVAPVPFIFLEIFIGFIQAFIFAILTLIFLKIATETAEAH